MMTNAWTFSTTGIKLLMPLFRFPFLAVIKECDLWKRGLPQKKHEIEGLMNTIYFFKYKIKKFLHADGTF